MISGSSAITPKQRQAQDPVHVVNRQHLAASHQMRAETIDDELWFEAIAEQADNAIDVANRGNLRRTNHDRFIGAGDRVLEA